MIPEISARFDILEIKILENRNLLVELNDDKFKNDKYKALKISNLKDITFKNIILIIAVIASVILACINAPNMIGTCILGGFVTCFFPAIAVCSAAGKVFSH